MTLAQLNSELTRALKNYIRAKGHNDSGSLYNSIKFNCTDGAGGLKIKFKTNDYIQYLDKGNFVLNFIALDSTLDIIAEYTATTIIINLD